MNQMTGLIIAQGWRYIGYAAAALLLFMILDCEFMATMSFVALLLLGWIYRNPARGVTEYMSSSVVAPCDGRVRAIISEDDQDFRIEVETGCLDVSLLRAPVDAKLVAYSNFRGARLGMHSDKGGALNERASLRFEDENGLPLIVEHRSLQGFAPIEVELKEGDRTVRGVPYGVMIHGITSIDLPPSARVAVNIGERIRAGETLIGYLA